MNNTTGPTPLTANELATVRQKKCPDCGSELEDGGLSPAEGGQALRCLGCNGEFADRGEQGGMRISAPRASSG